MIRSEDLLTPSDHLAALKSAVNAVNAPSAVVSATAVFANFGMFLQKPKRIAMNLSKSAAPWAPGCLYFQPRQQNRKRSLAGWKPETSFSVENWAMGYDSMGIYALVCISNLPCIIIF